MATKVAKSAVAPEISESTLEVLKRRYLIKDSRGMSPWDVYAVGLPNCRSAYGEATRLASDFQASESPERIYVILSGDVLDFVPAKSNGGDQV